MDKHLGKIVEFLRRDDFQGFTADDLFIKRFIKQGWGQEIATLSNMAEGFRNIALNTPNSALEMIGLMNEVIARAIHPSVNPWRKPLEKVVDLGHFGYYLEHLNIILGCYQRMGGTRHWDLNTRVTTHLHQASLSQSNAHARLLPHIKMRWAADQAAILYSLWLYDQNNGTQYLDEPRRRWLEYMHANATHQVTGLFVTEVMGTKKYSKQPRGCSAAYMIYYMSYFEPKLAGDQWSRFKTHMGIDFLGIRGFREYLPEFKGGWTPDSGPIIAGMGVAATGLALKASSALRDERVFRDISRLESVCTSALIPLTYVPLVKNFACIGTDLLSTSIVFAAKTLAPNRE